MCKNKVDREKIIIMTKLAIYDKKYGYEDKKIIKFFEYDYIYYRNFCNRFFAFIGSIIIIFLYEYYIFIFNEEYFFKRNYILELRNIAIFIICILLFYSIISTRISFLEYKKAKIRNNIYLKLIKKLEVLNY